MTKKEKLQNNIRSFAKEYITLCKKYKMKIIAYDGGELGTDAPLMKFNKMLDKQYFEDFMNEIECECKMLNG